MAHRLAVLGGGVAGLSAAIHGALEGWDVELYEQRSDFGGKASAIETQGYRLDPGPSIVILPEIYADVFARAGRRMEDSLRFRRLAPITRVFWNGEPLDIPADLDAASDLVSGLDAEDGAAFRDLMRRLARVAPLVRETVFARPLERWWSLLDPKLIRSALPLWPGKSYKDAVDGLFRHPLLRAFFYGFPSYSGGSYRKPNIGAFLIPYFMFAEGVWYPEGGVAAIPAAFERLALDLGVTIHRHARVIGFRRDGREIVAAELAGEQEIEAEAFVVAFDRFSAAAMLGAAETRPPSFSYFTVHYGVRDRLHRLAHHTLVVPPHFEFGFDALYDRREFPEPPIVYLNAPGVADPQVEPFGRTNLFAVVTAPSLEPHLDWPALELSGRRAVEASLRTIGVDVESTGTDFVRIQTPLTFAERDGNYRGSLYGVDEAHRLFRGILPYGPSDRRFRNLAYAGGSVQPGAGLPMATLSGRFAVESLR